MVAGENVAALDGSLQDDFGCQEEEVCAEREGLNGGS